MLGTRCLAPQLYDYPHEIQHYTRYIVPLVLYRPYLPISSIVFHFNIIEWTETAKHSNIIHRFAFLRSFHPDKRPFIYPVNFKIAIFQIFKRTKCRRIKRNLGRSPWTDGTNQSSNCALKTISAIRVQERTIFWIILMLF